MLYYLFDIDDFIKLKRKLYLFYLKYFDQYY